MTSDQARGRHVERLGSARPLRSLFRPSLIVLYVMGAYLLVNFVIRASKNPYPEAMKLFNFVIFAGLLYFLLRKPLSSIIGAKIAELDRNLRESLSQLEDLRIKHVEASQLVAGMEGEASEIIARVTEQGESERARLIADGTKRAEAIIAQATVALESSERRSRQTVQQEIVRRAIERARLKIRNDLTPAMHLAIIRSRISMVGKRQ